MNNDRDEILDNIIADYKELLSSATDLFGEELAGAVFAQQVLHDSLEHNNARDMSAALELAISRLVEEVPERQSSDEDFYHMFSKGM